MIVLSRRHRQQQMYEAHLPIELSLFHFDARQVSHFYGGALHYQYLRHMRACFTTACQCITRHAPPDKFSISPYLHQRRADTRV